jgi:anti-sigma-K factor RskA
MGSASASATCFCACFESNVMADTTEELRKRPEIRKELERARGEKRSEKVETEGGAKFWFVVYAVVLAICAAIYFAVGARARQIRTEPIRGKS